MNENKDASKSKEKRLEEKEKLDAEAERSLAVVRTKQIHKQIEDIEKMRKRAAVMSLCERLMSLAATVNNFAHTIAKLNAPQRIDAGVYPSELIQNYFKIYESIRYDFLKTLEISNEDFEKLFPRMTAQFGDTLLVFSSLVNMVDQLIQMRIYCNRMLFG